MVFFFGRLFRYLLWNYLVLMVAACVVILSMFISMNFLLETRHFPQWELISLVKLYIYRTPNLLFELVPLAQVAATIFLMGGLVRSREWTAMVSVGVSFSSLLSFFLLVTGGISLGLFFLGRSIIPSWNEKALRVEFEIQKGRPYREESGGGVWHKYQDQIFYMKDFSPWEKRGEEINVFLVNPETGHFDQITQAQSFQVGDEGWVLKKGRSILVGSQYRSPLEEPFDEKVLPLQDDLGAALGSIKPAQVLSMEVLSDLIRRGKESGLQNDVLEFEFYRKWSQLFVSPLLCWLSILLVAGHGRQSGGMAQLGLAMILGLGFHAFMTYMGMLGRNGYFRPWLAAFLPGMILLGGIIWLSSVRRWGKGSWR